MREKFKNKIAAKMLVLAHTGITLGIFNLSQRILAKWHIDYRFVLLGSMFPDIADKPVGMLIFANAIANGRVYFHTLLVNLILLLVGFYLAKRKKPHFSKDSKNNTWSSLYSLFPWLYLDFGSIS